jgi:hypothetical protein
VYHCNKKVGGGDNPTKQNSYCTLPRAFRNKIPFALAESKASTKLGESPPKMYQL